MRKALIASVIACMASGLVGQSTICELSNGFGWNLGAAGVQFDIVANNSVVISDFDINLRPGNYTRCEVYIVTGGGSKVGNESNPAAWTHVGTSFNINSPQTGVPIRLGLNLSVPIAAGQTQGFYVTMYSAVTNADWLKFRTNGGSQQNADLSILTGSGHRYLFLPAWPNATFSGRVYYSGCAPQPASATAYGFGCGSPTLDFVPTSVPVIGGTATAEIQGAPTQIAGASMGWSNVGLFPILLPYELSGIGMPGCYLLQSNEVFGLGVAPGAGGVIQFALSVPFQSSLVGAHVYLQAFSYAPGVNSRNFISSNGIDWLIGNQ